MSLNPNWSKAIDEIDFSPLDAPKKESAGEKYARIRREAKLAAKRTIMNSKFSKLDYRLLDPANRRRRIASAIDVTPMQRGTSRFVERERERRARRMAQPPMYNKFGLYRGA